MQNGYATNGYVPGYLEEIKRRISLVDIVSVRVNLKKSGRNYKGNCPFHGEKSPSFFVFPETESYYCFGCHESGDIFGFTMKTEGLGFSEALEQLAARAGVQLPERNPKDAAETAEEQSRKAERERLKEINAVAATYFQHLLTNSKEGQVARDYLTKRGISREAIELFGLGYALDSWTALFDYLTAKNRFSVDEIVKAGLVVEKQDDNGASTGKYFDRFRGRLIFPIRDRQGVVIAFGGRVMDNAPKDAPKYLNSPQTPLFDKSSTLYAFDLAKDAIRRTDRVVIVEGYMDTIVAHQYGYSNVVAPLGTALTPKHVGMIKKLTKRVVLALDADTAGEMASLKGIEVMKQGFDTKTVVVPNARGLIKFEQELDADVRVAVLPKGKDPDEVIKENPTRWRELIERALPTVDYYFAAVAATLDINSARGKSEAVERLAGAIVEVRDRIAREHYIQKLAQLVHLDVSLVRTEVNKAARREQPRPVQASPEEPPMPDAPPEEDSEAAEVAPVKHLKVKPEFTPEDFMLAFLLRYKDGFEIAGADGVPVALADFDQTESREIFQALIAAQQSRVVMDIEDTIPPELQSHLAALQEYSMSQPELEDLYSIREAGTFLLNRLREARLRRLYEQGTETLENADDAENVEDAAFDAMWQTVSTIASQLRLYYPKPSVIFRDTRSYK